MHSNGDGNVLCISGKSKQKQYRNMKLGWFWLVSINLVSMDIWVDRIQIQFPTWKWVNNWKKLHKCLRAQFVVANKIQNWIWNISNAGGEVCACKSPEMFCFYFKFRNRITLCTWYGAIGGDTPIARVLRESGFSPNFKWFFVSHSTKVDSNGFRLMNSLLLSPESINRNECFFFFTFSVSAFIFPKLFFVRQLIFAIYRSCIFLCSLSCLFFLGET